MFDRQNNGMNAFEVGTVRKIEGYPIPVTGLISPHRLGDDSCAVFIDTTTALHVRRTEVAYLHVTFAEWFRANVYTAIGKSVEAVLPADEPVDLYAFLAAVEYCKRAKLVDPDDVRSATRIVAEAHADLRRQVAEHNGRAAH